MNVSKINKKEDEGAYECEVEFSSNPGSTSQTKLHLNVISKLWPRLFELFI